MPRTRLLALLAIAVVAGLMVTGCKNPIGLTEDTRITSHWVYEPEVYTNWAGSNIDVGTVTVWNTPETLYIKYDMTGNWWLEETHAHVALKLKDIPQRYGVPTPDRFEFKDDWHPRVKTCTYAIPVRKGWNVGVNLYMATHSVVVKVDRRGRVTQREEGWAGPYFFSGGNLCCHKERYIKYEFKEVYKDVTLPTGTVQMRVNLDGGNSQFTVELKGVPDGFDVWDANWVGWCGEHGIKSQYNTWFDVTLVSSQDPNLPERFQNAGWHKVNYLLNHKHMEDGSTFVDVQIAAWYLLGQWQKSLGSWSQTLVDEANANAGSWQPAKGDWIAVICVTPTEVQAPFIEVDP